MKKLTQKQLKELLVYEPDTGYLRWREMRGSRAAAGSIAGSLSPKGYVRIEILGTGYNAHALAWLYVYGEWPSRQLDHINGKPADNAIQNLRLCNTQQNCAGRLKRKDNSTGFKGVSQVGDKWRARIRVDYKGIDLGRHNSPKRAALAYDNAAVRFYGEFARTNKALGLL